MEYKMAKVTFTEAEAEQQYGKKLAEVIRTNTDDFTKLSIYEKFILDRGFEFNTEEELMTWLWKNENLYQVYAD